MTTTQTYAAFVVAIAFVVSIGVLVDLLRRPHWAFQEAKVNRPLWIVLLALSWICGIGLLVPLYYLFFVGPKVRRVEHLGHRLVAPAANVLARDHGDHGGRLLDGFRSLGRRGHLDVQEANEIEVGQVGVALLFGPGGG